MILPKLHRTGENMRNTFWEKTVVARDIYRGDFSGVLHFQRTALLLADKKLVVHDLVPRYSLNIIFIKLVISPPLYIFSIPVAI